MKQGRACRLRSSCSIHGPNERSLFSTSASSQNDISTRGGDLTEHFQFTLLHDTDHLKHDILHKFTPRRNNPTLTKHLLEQQKYNEIRRRKKNKKIAASKNNKTVAKINSPNHLLVSSAHQMVDIDKKQQRKSKSDPLTTQASSAAAGSSRPRVASRAQGAGAAKIR